MADEEISVSLNTAGYEGPLSKLTTAMNTFNTASVMATAQQKQMAKVMTDLGSIYSSYAKILVQTAKATALAVEGPSEALNKKFQNAQRVLANMDRELQKLQATGEKISNIPLVPKDLTRTGKAFGDAFERVFKNIEQRAAQTGQKVAQNLQKAQPTGTTNTGAPTYDAEAVVAAQALQDTKAQEVATKALTAAIEEKRAAQERSVHATRLAQRPDLMVAKLGIAPISGATAGEQEKLAKAAQRVAAAFTDQTKTIESNEDAMEILKQTMLGVRDGTIQVDATNVKTVKALQDLMQLYSGVETRVEALTKAERDAADAETLLVQRTQMVSAALHKMYDAAISSLPREQRQPYFKQLNDLTKTIAEGTTDLNTFDKVLDTISKDMLDLKTTTDSGVLAINTFNTSLTKAGAKVGFADRIKKDVIELEQAFKKVTGIDPARLNPRQQQIMHAAFDAAARSAGKLGVEVKDLTAIWQQYQAGTLQVDVNNRETVNILNDVTAASERAGMAVDKYTRQWQRFSQLIFARALTMAFYNLFNALRQGVSTALDVSKAIGEIQTVSHDLPLQYDQWAEAILKVSNNYNALQTDVAEGFYQTLSNQVAQGQQAVNFMETSAAFAKATVSTMEDSVNLLSAALNAFQIPAEQTILVAAELFKTIELGRIRASDMADTLGRSAIMAHQAGISLEEYLAMIEQFTISGVRFSQASTFIINVINKLMKPSTEMKALFQEWGVSSGQAALQVYGLSGVLQKLLQETSGDLGELSDIIKDIRGITGAVGLLTNLDKVQANIKETAQGVRDYFQAVKEVTTTTGYIITAEANKVKNIFISQAATALSVLAIIDKAANSIGLSLSGIGTAAIPAVEALTILGTFTIGRTLLDFDVETTKAISKFGRKLALFILFEEVIRNTIKSLQSYEGVMNRNTQMLEQDTIDILTVSKQYEMDIQKINQKHVQELMKTQEKEKLLLQLQVDSAKENQKELLQINQQTRE
jgi:TP901 family phage tail tape measure protein